MKDFVDFMKSFDLHTIIIVAAAFWWMNGNVNEGLVKTQSEIASIKEDLNELKTDMAVAKAVLLMKNILPAELAKEK